MNETIDLKNKTVLITGATGFIGGRLIDYLVQHYQADVRALVRSYGRAVRLARLPVQLVSGDLMDPVSLKEAVAGCDIVFHCGFGASGDDETRRTVTVDGTRNILAAAHAARVKRFVHVSTIAVHGPDPGLSIDEDTPYQYSGDVYGDAKIDAEKLALSFCEQGLPVSILRPTIVYGPRAGGWTVGHVNNMKSGRHILFDGGTGIANHVYVDDVVQALLLAATRPQAVGEAFIVSHGTGVTWHEFFGHYARMLDIEQNDLPVAEINRVCKQMAQLRNPLNMGLSFMASPHAQSIIRELPVAGPAINLASKAIPKSARDRAMHHATTMRQIKLSRPKLPRQWIIDLFCAKGVCKIDKAQQLLGYQPQFGLDAGMKLTEAWLRYTRVI